MWNDTDTAHGTPATMSAIRRGLYAREKLIQHIYLDLKEYNQLLFNGSDRGLVACDVRKISGMILKMGDIQRLQQDLQAHLEALILLLSLFPW